MAPLRGLGLAVLAGWMAPSALADEPAEAVEDARLQTWRVRVARMEGASVNVEEAASALVETSGRIASSGRIHGLSDLVSDADHLHRRVVSLTLATEVLDELEP